jgi:hypothetical protein
MINTETFRTQYITNMAPDIKVVKCTPFKLGYIQGNQALFLTIISHSLLQL